MKWQKVLVGAIILVGVPVAIIVTALATTQIRSTEEVNGGFETPVTKAQNNNDEAEVGSEDWDFEDVEMLDPQGDAELARLVVSQAVSRRAPKVVLSRRVMGGQLPCLGYLSGVGTSLEMRPTDTFGLVVLAGELTHNFSRTFPAPYLQYVFDIEYGAVTIIGGVDWPPLRAAFGGSEWPEDSPMFLSPEGEPGLAELERPLLANARPAGATQRIGTWTVTVQEVSTSGNYASVVFTVTGPKQRYTVDQPLLQVAGTDFQTSDGWNGSQETLGPSVNIASTWDLPETQDPQDVTFRFTVPAIRVRPPRNPCEIPSLRPEDYPTPTRISGEIPSGGYEATPVPDMQMVGPFTFEFAVHVEPRPTQPPVPTPIPTAVVTFPVIPSPQATGQP